MRGGNFVYGSCGGLCDSLGRQLLDEVHQSLRAETAETGNPDGAPSAGKVVPTSFLILSWMLEREAEWYLALVEIMSATDAMTKQVAKMGPGSGGLGP